MEKDINLYNGKNDIHFEQGMESVLSKLLKEITYLRNELKSFPLTLDKQIFNSEDVKELLGIKDKLLKKYRDDGLLTYHQVGDKYWYTLSDINQFIENNTFSAYKYS